MKPPKNKWPWAILIALFSFFLIGEPMSGMTRQPPTEIIITMPYDPNIRSLDSNYFVNWLEEQSGLSIRIQTIPQSYTDEYVESMFAAGYVTCDAFWGFPQEKDRSALHAKLLRYGASGYILPLNAWLEEAKHFRAIAEDFQHYDLLAAMTTQDGFVYYFPRLDPSAAKSNFQVLWINQGWLKKLGLSLPRTVEEFHAVLRAFKTLDPNGNGLADEIPLAGCNDVAAEQAINALINAFVYNDPHNARLYLDDGKLCFAPVTDAWREAMRFLRDLYEEGLLSPLSFDLEHPEFVQLANDPLDILGAFAAGSIADVLQPNSPEVISRFAYAGPLKGPSGTRYATVKTPVPQIGGVITSACQDPAAVVRLFDLMLSEEAFLIGRFGEEGVDWRPAASTMIDLYGGKARVNVLHPLWNGVQNKHIGEAGPFYAYPQYADSVTWNGIETDQEYIDARAAKVYEPYIPVTHITMLVGGPETGLPFDALREAIEAYVDASITRFVTGQADPDDNGVWEAYLRGFDALRLGEWMETAESL